MDVAFIKSYDTYFVSSVTKSNGVYTVYDKFDSGRKLILDEDIDDITVKLVNNGSDELKDGSLNSISSSSVLSVAVSAGDSNRKEIIVSKKTASGSSATSEVKSISSGNFTIKFGTKSVDSSNYYLANKSLETQKLSVGDTCTAYLDFTGKLVAVNKKATTTNYGYITKVGTRSSSMDDSEYLVRMYDTSGRLHSELPVATKGFKINGSSADPEDLIEAVEASALLLNENKDESKIENAEQATLVKYELSNGQLKSVYLVDEDEDNAIVPKHISEGESALTYRSSSNSFRSGSNTKFTISSTTKVIVVPLDRTASNYRITSGTGYFTDGLTYMIDAFDAGAGSLAKVVVVYGVNTTIKATAETYLVKSVDEELNDKNEEIHTLSYYKLGSSELLTIQGADEDTFDGVESGDVIRVLKNGDVVDKVQRLFSAEDKELISEDIINDGGNYDENIEGGLYQNTAGSTYTAVYGTVISKFGEMADGSNKETIEVSASGDEEDAISFKTSSSTAVVRYVGDESNNNNTVFEFDKNEYDIMDINPDPDDASKVLVIRYNSGAIKGIIIYE